METTKKEKTFDADTPRKMSRRGNLGVGEVHSEVIMRLG